MRSGFFAALALGAGSSLPAQGTIPDLATATPIAGTWTYAATAGGSEATFVNAANFPQLWLHCTRASRRVTLARPASGAAPFLNVWTSSQSRSVPSSYNPATGRLTIDLGAYDPLFDALVSSRGRIGFTVGMQPPLVVPPWPEPARVIEDCRS